MRDQRLNVIDVSIQVVGAWIVGLREMPVATQVVQHHLESRIDQGAFHRRPAVCLRSPPLT